MKVANEDGEQVDLNAELSKTDLVALVKHWRHVANVNAELLRRVEQAIDQVMKVEASEFTRDDLIKMAMRTLGVARDEAEKYVPVDPEPYEVTTPSGKRMVRPRRASLPIMSEGFLYLALGKETARSILYPLESARGALTEPSFYKANYERHKSDLERLAKRLHASKEFASWGTMLRYFLDDWVIDPKRDDA